MNEKAKKELLNHQKGKRMKMIRKTSSNQVVNILKNYKYNCGMELNKDYGVYLEVQNIEDKNDKYMFTELLDTLIKSNRRQLDSDGWYYPKEGTKGRYESCIAFSFMIVTRFK